MNAFCIKNSYLTLILSSQNEMINQVMFPIF